MTMAELFRGFAAFFEASLFLRQQRMLRWYLLPVMLWGILFIGLAISVSGQVEALLLLWLQEGLGIQLDLAAARESGWLATLKAFASLAVAFLVKALVWILLGRVMKYVILVIMAPAMAYLSEKTEALVTGREYAFSLPQWLSDTGKGLVVTLRNFSLEMGLWLITFLAAVVFPLLALPALAVMFVASAWFMGFNMFYYLLERQKLTIGQTLQMTRNYRARVLGLGLAYNLVSLLPLLDWVIAPVNGPVAAVLASRGTSLLPGRIPAA